MKIVLLIFILFSNILFANETILKSGDKKVTLIELYTSQGCSSCPPADKWLSQLKNKDGLFKTFIPLAFHVTYWDFIGWKDIFANSLNDNRQRNYSSKVWKKNSVYTPQFIVDTKEYRQWFNGQPFPRLQNSYAGNLEAKLSKNKNLEVKYNNKNIKNKKVLVNMAILGFDYNIDIKRGENKSRVLEHDFVVLKHIQKYAAIKNHNLDFKNKLYQLKKEPNKKYALVVWISDENYNQLQAVGGYIN
ncbi:DUF1223 domain-containing protein [Poseidonibacter lekithochrous]|uniref:DUF1223 domain-containing protein n=1 Tax=Poseidonibacter lekithochrous TaxID=1904463 RepID=UPI0008FCCAA8|nr:DUF1223 domain-containing protein [Poseidonibacter lekithochrous]QKJ21804.1 DUF1223 domain-containing protein [Poseidonibacter lekithochrous]